MRYRFPGANIKGLLYESHLRAENVTQRLLLWTRLYPERRLPFTASWTLNDVGIYLANAIAAYD